jgi:hypothetical protein
MTTSQSGKKVREEGEKENEKEEEEKTNPQPAHQMMMTVICPTPHLILSTTEGTGGRKEWASEG